VASNFSQALPHALLNPRHVHPQISDVIARAFDHFVELLQHPERFEEGVRARSDLTQEVHLDAGAYTRPLFSST